MVSAASLMDAPSVLVTGGNGGLGRAICRLVVERGGEVAIGCRLEEQDECRDFAASLGSRAMVVVGDITDPSDVERMVQEVLERLPHLSGLVNNAGVLGPVSQITDVDVPDWRTVLDTNLTGTFLMSRALIGHLRTRTGAAIVNMSSQLAYIGAPDLVAYCTSKAGLLGFTRALAHDLAGQVRVNAVAPGPIDTSLHQGVEDTTWLDKKLERVVMHRFGTPAEVATVVWFLLTNESSYMTGQTIAPNGGGAFL
ncbi:SDR family oxidoreductase [Microbacterium sp. X-17]|uniref:SDR family NAD(P)-dependent oxidoreductase n=1 Tax=Microbacterium sp. X-17 TaxID=3144404 RepID=UPI0031F5C76D